MWDKAKEEKTMIKEDTPIEAWMQIHYLRNKGERNIKVSCPTEKSNDALVRILSRNNQPYDNPRGKGYLIAYPT